MSWYLLARIEFLAIILASQHSCFFKIHLISDGQSIWRRSQNAHCWFQILSCKNGFWKDGSIDPNDNNDCKKGDRNMRWNGNGDLWLLFGLGIGIAEDVCWFCALFAWLNRMLLWERPMWKRLRCVQANANERQTRKLLAKPYWQVTQEKFASGQNGSVNVSVAGRVEFAWKGEIFICLSMAQLKWPCATRSLDNFYCWFWLCFLGQNPIWRQDKLRLASSK